MLAVIAGIGLWFPWNRLRGSSGGTAWLWAAGWLARLAGVSIADSCRMVIWAAALLALLAFLLPWLGARSSSRWLLPAYWLNSVALAVLMPPAGALFAITAMTLVAGIGWTLHRRSDPGGHSPTLVYLGGACFTFAALGGRFNATLLEQGVLISAGAAVLLCGWIAPRIKRPA